MNICLVIGEIKSEIEFNFLYDNKNISICIFEIELTNKSIIKVKAYNELADFVYSKLGIGSIIWIGGHIEEKFIIAEEISKMPESQIQVQQKFNKKVDCLIKMI